MAMLLDNNLGCDMVYAKELLAEIAKLNLWALGAQFSFDCLYDDEFVELLVRANCKMAFLGLESLNEPSLASVHKMQNKVEEYKALFAKLKRHGILTFTGLMLALDGDTPEYYKTIPDKLEEIDPSSILLSISIPIPGTPFYNKVKKEGRIIDSNLAHYEGDHLVLKPKQVSKQQVFRAFRQINKVFYSWRNILRRLKRFLVAMDLNQNLLKKLFHSVLVSFILLKLSIFQRDHARKKVFSL
jgi:radical SAM superfamily enzyme YgiQ (UPF0313 family)